jgi:hypothetical protein
MGDFSFDSDPFGAVKSGADFFGGSSAESHSTKSTADSSRSGETRRGKLQRSRSTDDDGGFKAISFADPSFGSGEGGGLPAAAQRASRSRRRASIATSSTMEANNRPQQQAPEFGNFDAPAFDEPSFEAPAPAPLTRRPGRARRVSVVGSGMPSAPSAPGPDNMSRADRSSRTLDTGSTGGMEAISRTNKSSRALAAGRSKGSNASVGSSGDGSGGGRGPSNPGAAAAAPAPPRRRTNRRGSIAAAAMDRAPEPEPEPEPAADDYGYGYGEEQVEAEPDNEYGYGDSEPSGFGGGAPRDTFGASAAAPPKSSRRMSCMNTTSTGVGSSADPYADLKNGMRGGGFGDNGGSYTSTQTNTTSKPSLGSGSSRQLNIMLPMTSAGPEKPKEAAVPKPSRRRASMLGMVGNLTGGGGGGGEKMQSLEDDNGKKGAKKGFFKDRNGGGAPPGRTPGSSADAPTSSKNRDRRREGAGLLDRLDATAPSARGEGRSQGVSYSDRIMKN